jgi:3-hydroxyisobutyrate dehydrogenase-like beta-hydroxyacid dehydrogenase
MAEGAPVGLIGVGLMGEVCARRLLAAGFSVIGFADAFVGRRTLLLAVSLDVVTNR